MEIEKSYLLVFSSLIFLTNVATTMCREMYVYSFLFLCLTITSVIVHYDTNIYTTIIDKIFVVLVVLYGGYVFYNKITGHVIDFIIIFSFILVLFLYCYGYMTNDYCYHSDPSIANMYHCLLHMTSSFGHHLIVF